MTDDKILLDIWKTTVEVQQHFNTLELQIRSYAVTLTAALLALGGYAIKENSLFSIFGLDISVSSLIIIASVIPIASFYFMDKYWYHRLLEGAVKAGAKAESELAAKGYAVSLGLEISAASPVINPIYGKRIDGTIFCVFPKRRMHSKHKMDVFYGVLIFGLVLMSVLLSLGKEQLAVNHNPEPSNNTDHEPEHGAKP
jgi:hypothetical protein